MSDINNIIRQLALENAVKYKGKANPKFVFGSVLAKNPDWRSKVKELNEILNPIVEEVNSLSIEEQTEELETLNPQFFEKKEKKERNIFAFLNIKEGDNVVSAFPPSPEKHYHIGHAKAILLNYLLTKKYNGKFYLRFEDTNPDNVKEEYYQAMKDDIAGLGVEWDDIQYACDHMDLFIEYATKLIKEDKAYVCFCDSSTMSDKRKTGDTCECRIHSIEENLKLWNDMQTNMEEGKASLRLKIDMQHKNYRMRDPSIFRILDKPHPRHGDKYRVYPMYDFQNAVLDGYFKVTHRFRTIEFEMASELHHYIRNLLDLYDTYTYEFSRFNLDGMLSSGRAIREVALESEYTWSDPSLPTLKALKRRGFTTEAIKQLVVESGITKSAGAKLTWDTLYKYNRRVLNDTAKRYFFIENPIEINVDNDPKNEYILNVHPNLDLGKRNFISNGTYYIEKEDLDSFKDNDLIRLMDNVNITVDIGQNKYNYHSQDYLDFKNYKESKKIIHFLPNDVNQLTKVTILKPDHTIATGIAEKSIESLKIGDIIQFERYCFCRLDSITEEDGKKVYNFWFTHK